jgi:hypothetical protein
MMLPPHFPRTAPSMFDLVTARPGTIHRIIYVALQEWSYFGGTYESLKGNVRAGHNQTESPYYKRVGEYWRYGSGNKGLDGKDKNFWSATFISYVLRKAGVSDHDFHRNARHSKYIHFAIQNRVKHMVGAKFVGRRITEYRPKEGDVICNSRDKANMTYDKAITHDDYDGHCDIVVYVRPGEIGVIGGNVGANSNGFSPGHRTVGLRARALTSGGYLKNRKSDPFFAILENRLPLK